MPLWDQYNSQIHFNLFLDNACVNLTYDHENVFNQTEKLSSIILKLKRFNLQSISSGVITVEIHFGRCKPRITRVKTANRTFGNI